MVFQQMFQPGLPAVHNGTAAVPDLQRRQLLQPRVSHSRPQRLPQVRVPADLRLPADGAEGPAPAAAGRQGDHSEAGRLLHQEQGQVRRPQHKVTLSVHSPVSTNIVVIW